MHKSFVIRVKPKSIELLPVKMGFSSLLDELERAEADRRAPRLQLGTSRTLTTAGFAEFCRKHGLLQACGGDGFQVFTKPDFVWPSR